MKKSYLTPLIVVLSLCTNIMCSSNYNTEESATTKVTATTEVLLDGEQCSWDGTALIDYPTGKPAITMLRITVAPKSKLAQHYHPVINVGYMLEGSLTVTDNNGNNKTIKAGEPLIETVNTIHYGENRGDTEAVILVFYAGEEGETITEVSDTYPKQNVE